MEDFLSGRPLKPRQVADGLRALYNKVLKEDRPSNVNDLWKEHLIIRHILGIATKEQKKFGDEELLDHPRTDEDLETFLKWSETQGIRHDSVDVVRSPEGDEFGLRANRPIKEGETLVKVPREVMITTDTAIQSEMLAMLFAERHFQLDNVVLSIFLLCEKFSQDSKWEPYIKMLPTKFVLPVFYSLEQLECLKPSPLFESTLCFYRNLAHQFCVTFEDVYDLHIYKKKKNKMNQKPPLLLKTPLTVHNFNFDTWKWAACCVLTRMAIIPNVDSNGDPIEGMGGIAAFIPVVDFANHTYNPEIIVEASLEHDGNQQYAQIRAHRDFEAGEMNPVLDIHRSNMLHFERNGSLLESPENSDHGRYRLKLPIPRSDKDYELKTQFFESLGYTGEDAYTFVLSVNAIVLIPPPLFSLAKIIVCKCLNAYQYCNLETKVKAYRYLKNRFMLLRCTYKIIEGTNDFEKEIERLHRGEVNVLQKAEEFCAKMERELQAETEPLAAVAEAGDNVSDTVDVEAPVPEAAGSETPAPNAGAPDASDAEAEATEK